MEFINSLAGQGILGLLLAISLTIIGILGKMLLYEKDKRIDDALKVRDEIITPLNHIKDSLSLIDSKITISKEAQK